MINDNKEKAFARKELYHWLSAAFYKPEKDVLQEDFIETLRGINNILGYGLEDKIEELENSTKEKDLDFEKLLIEYSKLCIGPSSLLAPPYGSYYLDEGRVMGDSTLEVIKFYRNSKMELLADFKDLPDHIAVELSFLSQLCDFEEQALQQGKNDVADALLQRQNLFLNNHLLPWLERFTQKVKTETRISFYKTAAAILDQALTEESKYLPCKAH